MLVFDHTEGKKSSLENSMANSCHTIFVVYHCYYFTQINQYKGQLTHLQYLQCQRLQKDNNAKSKSMLYQIGTFST